MKKKIDIWSSRGFGVLFLPFLLKYAPYVDKLKKDYYVLLYFGRSLVFGLITKEKPSDRVSPKKINEIFL